MRAGKDLIGLGQTGSGKTGAFALPIIQALLDDRRPFFALVLSPTRSPPDVSPLLFLRGSVCVHCLLTVPRMQGAGDSDCRAVRGARVGHWLGLRSGEGGLANYVSTFLALLPPKNIY